MRANLAYIPSPSQGVWLNGYVKAYALCIVAGIIAAVWIGERRWVARGGQRGTVSDVAIWAVIFGLVGGRIYHVITDWELYFGTGRQPIDVFKIWQGGLGIWGAISFGGVGAWLSCRRRGIYFRNYADAVIPGVAVAQAIGRWGNWFNQELFGKPTTLPWGLKIDPLRPDAVPGAQAYHPTFLYESIWDLGLAGVLIWVDRRFRLGRGRVLALYIMGYPLGRVWIEALRIDNTHDVFGLRLNIWTSIVVFLIGLALFLLWTGPRDAVVEPGATAVDAGEVAADGAAVTAGSVDENAEASADPDDPATEEVAGEPEPALAAPGAVSEPGAEVDTAAPDAAEGPAGDTDPDPAAGKPATSPDAAPEPAAAADPDPADPDVADPDAADPEAPDPDAADSDAADSDAADPDAADPDVADPDAADAPAGGDASTASDVHPSQTGR